MQEAAGAKADDVALARMLASGDFDAAEYDRAMAAAFGEDYYEARHACPLWLALLLAALMSSSSLHVTGSRLESLTEQHTVLPRTSCER